MSTWSGHIADQELARKCGGNAIIADNDLGMGTSDITTVAVAEAAATANNINTTIVALPDRAVTQQCARGFRYGYNLSATFGSTFAAYESSLPDSTGHKRQVIT